jgi:hypothetical protein
MANPGDGSSALGGAGAGELARSALATARRFAAGATMWCLAPAWPEHARHIAVEFVHPVIVGKRALPAVAVDDPDPVAALRSLVRAGDVLIAVSNCSSRPVLDAMRRAPAWGVTSLWIGTGPRPPASCAYKHEVSTRPERYAALRTALDLLDDTQTGADIVSISTLGSSFFLPAKSRSIF